MANQKAFRSIGRVDGVTAVVTVSDGNGMQKEGRWVPSAKKRFFDETRAKGIAVTIACNGTFCLTKKDWQDFKEQVEIFLEDLS